jgi:hypothetical protein
VLLWNELGQLLPGPHLYHLPSFAAGFLVHSVHAELLNMGILSRKAPLPTAIDTGDDKNSPAPLSGDPEKTNDDAQLENSTIGAHDHNIDSELEKRVVRKLDWHVPPLVAFLCESKPNNNFADGDETKLWKGFRANISPP